MRKDYEQYFQNLKIAMNQFGYISLKENELDAEFYLENEWILEFVGEKYYGPAFDLSITTTQFDKERKKYAYHFLKNGEIETIRYKIFYIKLAFERIKGKCYEDLPEDEIQSEIAFLKREKNTVFYNPHFYEEEYNIIRHLSPNEKNAIIASHKAGIVTPAATKPHPEETDS